MLVHAQRDVFPENFYIFAFLGPKDHKTAMSKVRTIVCCSKYSQNDFRFQAKAPRREALAIDNLAVPLIFFSLLR